MSGRTRIKVCGITRQKDAERAIALGADSLGFIFAQSPRQVDPDRVREITGMMPLMVDAVGVFVNEELHVVKEIIQYCGLTMVQLHGDESPAFCRDVNCRVMKSFRVGPHTTAEDLAPYGGQVQGFLLDTYHRETAGGTGEVFDWELVERIAPPGPVILAGGLGPDNVGEAIRKVRPFAVDVNSGVESAPGRKDYEKLKAFFAAVRDVDGAIAAG